MKALKDYFIPHEGNEQMPHILRPQTVAFVVMVALVAEAAFVFGAKYIIPSSKLFGIIQVNALIDETNQNRVANGLPALQVNPLLMAAAQEKVNDMTTKGYFAHTSPQGLTPWYWFENVGYSFSYAGENLAVNFADSQDVTNAWMNSPEHRANILDTNYTQIGMAAAQGVFNGQPATYVVEEFGTPAAAPIAFVNAASAASIPTTAAQPPVVTTAPAKTPAPKAAVRPVAIVPTIVAMEDLKTSSSQQSFVAVKAAAVGATGGVVGAANVPAGTVSAAASAPAVVPQQSNFLQVLLSNPKALANDFYLFLMVLFFAALGLNVFINIRTQHPRLIAGGLVVIVVAGLCVMLNQNIGFLQAVVL